MAGRYCGCSDAAVALMLARTRAPRRTVRICASSMYYTRGDRADGDGCGGGGEAGRAERRMVVISKATESDHGKNGILKARNIKIFKGEGFGLFLSIGLLAFIPLVRWHDPKRHKGLSVLR